MRLISSNAIQTPGGFVRARWLAVVIMSLTAWGLADQVMLKNGDRLSGAIQRSDIKELVIKTDYAGEVKVQFEAIQAIESNEHLHVALADGKKVVGPITTKGEHLVIATDTEGPVEAPKSSVATLRSPAEEEEYRKTTRPGPWEGWSGALNLGFSLTRGNSETRNLAIAFNSARKGLKDKLTLYANSVYATNDTPDAVPAVTANTVGGGARYDRDVRPRIFGFINGDFAHDELQTLDLRAIVGGGLGSHAVKSDSTTLDLLLGGNYTHESYSAPFDPNFPDKMSRQLGAMTLGDEFQRKLGKTTVIHQNLYFYPDLSDTGEYRSTFNLGTVTKLNKWLGWQNSFGSNYSSSPPEGKKKNDLLLSTGLSFSFAR